VPGWDLCVLGFCTQHATIVTLASVGVYRCQQHIGVVAAVKKALLWQQQQQRLLTGFVMMTSMFFTGYEAALTLLLLRSRTRSCIMQLCCDSLDCMQLLAVAV
jgi:hypothetical protein